MERHPVRLGFLIAVGVLLAVGLAVALSSLSTVLITVGTALFVAVGLNPLVTRLVARGLSRGVSVLIVTLGVLALLGALLLVIVPIIVDQVRLLATELPSLLADLPRQEWYLDLDESTGGGIGQLRDWLSSTIVDPNTWLALGGGVLQATASIAGGVGNTVFIAILTLYFLAGLPRITAAFYRLTPRSTREQTVDLTEDILAGVGNYLSGMAVLAAMNAVFSFIVLTIAGNPFAAVLAFLALLITFIPLVGSVISTVIVTLVCLMVSPPSALWVGIALVAYMQVEAYVLTPRVLSRAVTIPGSLVLIGAMVGGTLLGLLGALVAVPVTAALLLIIERVIVPRQELA
ncbi:AI-2E family transporter [Mycetocola reblochoni]|uniref:Integral membrane protein n=2 Tax=Mycetocola reblochoni TaxID=331618 RepID=A0A1R4ITA7_9MICO|nr:AI-2E family transporter [Mycetocola reblochoni]RLP71073.1 AI-2E family transporter [Mycetocola reblochoni]SJN22948.1 protein of unknown function UPF0118 [Mycetocola reblochoni REB411]